MLCAIGLFMLFIIRAVELPLPPLQVDARAFRLPFNTLCVACHRLLTKLMEMSILKELKATELKYTMQATKTGPANRR